MFCCPAVMGRIPAPTVSVITLRNKRNADVLDILGDFRLIIFKCFTGKMVLFQTKVKRKSTVENGYPSSISYSQLTLYGTNIAGYQ